MEHFNSMDNPNYTKDLKHIKNAIDELTNIVSDIKAKLGVVDKTNVNQMSLDLDLPNVTTTYSFYEQEQWSLRKRDTKW